ncbi:MAG: DNA/RNA non-specific endonuclease [Thalassobaculaceae bacterium]
MPGIGQRRSRGWAAPAGALVGALLWVTGPAAQTAPERAATCLIACPQGGPAATVTLKRSIYTLSVDPGTHMAAWAAYRVTRASIGKSPRRRWRRDPDLPPAVGLAPRHFKGAHAALGTDRGHLVPLASFAGTGAVQTTNYLSNIVPQKSALNRGPWAALEGAVRQLARRPGVTAVWVQTGPLFERAMAPMPAGPPGHKVPSGFWKTIAVRTAGGLKFAGFLFDQETARGADFCAARFALPLVRLERRTGLDLFGAPNPPAGDLRPALGC